MKRSLDIPASRDEQDSSSPVSARETCAHGCTTGRRAGPPIQKIQITGFVQLVWLDDSAMSAKCRDRGSQDFWQASLRLLHQQELDVLAVRARIRGRA